MQRLSQNRHPERPEGKWREIKIPVDVPFMNVRFFFFAWIITKFLQIVAAARIRIISTPFAKETPAEELPPLYAGQPISANLTIFTTYHWGLSPSDTYRQYILRFNIEEMVREWLVSGPKRGDFVAKVRFLRSFMNTRSEQSAKGRRNIHDTYHIDCIAPWRVCASQGHNYCSPDVRRSDHGIYGCPEYRNLSRTRG